MNKHFRFFAQISALVMFLVCFSNFAFLNLNVLIRKKLYWLRHMSCFVRDAWLMIWNWKSSSKPNPVGSMAKTSSFKVPLTPKIFFPLIKSTSFPNYFSEKIISIDKIPAFLQAFKLVISMFTTAQSGIWVGATTDVISRTRLKHSGVFWLGFERRENIFGLFVLHILSKMDKTFQWKNCII